MANPFATENRRFSNLVKEELWASQGYCRDVVTVNEATATSYVVGTVLGKVTATGKYVVSKETATNGSEVPAAVVIAEYSVPATTDTKVLVLAKGPAIVSKFGLQLDASWVGSEATVYAALEAKGINVNDSV